MAGCRGHMSFEKDSDAQVPVIYAQDGAGVDYNKALRLCDPDPPCPDHTCPRFICPPMRNSKGFGVA